MCLLSTREVLGLTPNSAQNQCDGSSLCFQQSRVEAGGTDVQGNPWLLSKIKASLGYLRLCRNNNNNDDDEMKDTIGPGKRVQQVKCL